MLAMFELHGISFRCRDRSGEEDGERYSSIKLLGKSHSEDLTGSNKSISKIRDIKRLQGVEADTVEILHYFTDFLYPERCLDVVHLELCCHVAHVIKDIY
jgi:hypothetical protein